MNFYEFCSLWEKTLAAAVNDGDSKLYANKLDNGTYDFSTERTPGTRGEIFLKTISYKDNQQIANVHSSLVFKPIAGKEGRISNVNLFHLARQRDDVQTRNMPQDYKNDFYNTVVQLSVSKIRNENADLIVYLDSSSPFNVDVIANFPRVLNMRTLTKNKYKTMVDYIMANPDLRVNTFVKRKNSVLAVDSIAAAALKRVANKLQNGDPAHYTVLRHGVQTNITVGSTMSLEITARMMAQEWAAAFAEVNALRRTRGLEVLGNVYIKPQFANFSTIKDHLIQTNYFNKNDAAIANPEAIKSVVVVDDNIDSCSTYFEINKILKSQLPNAKITWVIGIIKDPNIDSASCFK
jgi:hypothetical protein